jgi:hypothetical protein
MGEMSRVEEAKTAIWGQLIDSGETSEEDANALLETLVGAAGMAAIEKIRSRRVKETVFTDETGMICLAYVIPAAALDPEEMSEAHKKLAAWATLGSAIVGRKP